MKKLLIGLLIGSMAVTAFAAEDWVINPSTGNLDTIGMSDSDITDNDGRYLKLDCSNDPLTGQLDCGAHGLTTTGNIELHSTAELRFYDNGNYVGFEAPALTGDQIWVLPTAVGAAGTVLTDAAGNGTLSWAAAGGIGTIGSSTDHAIARWDGTGGDTLQDSKVFIDDIGNLTIGTGAAGIDYTLTFDGETNNGSIKWWEDEQYFEFTPWNRFKAPFSAIATTTGGLSLQCYSTTNTAAPQLGFYKSDTATLYAKTQTDGGDVLGQLVFYGVNTGGNFGIGTLIQVKQSDTSGVDSVPTNLILSTYSSTAINTNQLFLHGASGNIYVYNDNEKILWGGGGDASIYYDGTDMVLDTSEVGTGVLKIGSSDMWTANGVAAVTISNVAPAGVETATISGWLTVKKDDGTVVYLPYWT